MRQGLLLLFVCVASCSGPASPRRGPAPGAMACDHCPEMVVVPAGTAAIGSPEDEPDRQRDEGPVRTVSIAPFAVSRYEVTRAEYEAFVAATGRPVLGNCLTDRTQRGTWVIDADTTLRDPGFSQADDHPVACVSWEEAKAYVAWLDTQSDGGYRLLTESEWEYVARAGASTRYPWGDDPAAGCPFANGFDQTTMARYAGMDTSGYPLFDPMSCRDGWLNTAPVGSLSPNAFGVHDMIGNVAEWVEDCYSPSHDAMPATGAVTPSAGACADRMVKGGSWGTLAHNLRPADRVRYPASHRDDSIGIRVARTLRPDGS